MDDEDREIREWRIEIARQSEQERRDKIAIADLVLSIGSLEARLVWDIGIATRRRGRNFERPADSDSHVPKFLSDRFKEFKRRAREHFANRTFDSKFDSVHNLLNEILAVRNCLAHNDVTIHPTGPASIVVRIHRTDIPKDHCDWRFSDRLREFCLSRDELDTMTNTVREIANWINSVHIEFTEAVPNADVHWLDLPKFAWPGKFRNRPYPWDWDTQPEKVARFVCGVPAHP